jgi:imidazolonepropionase-like amidohydrolase
MKIRMPVRMGEHLTMKGLKVVLLTLSAVLLAASAVSQVSVYDTSDDLRRVPIPPVDRSHIPALVIQGATLLDGYGKAVVGDSVIVMRGDRIVSAGPRASVTVPSDVGRVIDAKGLWVMPGMIDLHCHLTSQRGTNIGAYPDTDAAAAIRGSQIALSAVDSGITTLRDPATTGDVALRLKEAVARGIILGPRIFWAGAMIASSGGHGDEATSTATGRWKPNVPNTRTYTADGPWEWRKAVREQIRRQVDWIKVSSPFTKEEITAAVDEAHREGMRVAIDSFGEYTDWAIEAGVDSVEHTLNMPDDEVALLAKHKTAFDPTLVAFHTLLTRGYPTAGIVPGAFYYTFSRRYPLNFPDNLKKVGEAYRAGVRIGVGTDIAFETEILYPDSYFKELGFLHEAGMPVAAVLASATRVGADILGMSDKLGTIEAGKIADVILLTKDPQLDLANLRELRYVVAGGKVVVDKAAR